MNSASGGRAKARKGLPHGYNAGLEGTRPFAKERREGPLG